VQDLETGWLVAVKGVRSRTDRRALQRRNMSLAARGEHQDESNRGEQRTQAERLYK
jgi:hypothetical protein